MERLVRDVSLSTWRHPLVLVLAALLVIAACGRAPTAGDASSKTLVLLYDSEPSRGLDPAAALGTVVDGQYLQAVYGRLLYQDDTGTVRPGLAESASPSPDSSVWTIKLRPGVVFSDGTPFDAGAVVAHWTRMLDPATASPGRTPLTEIASTDVVDPTTLVVRLKEGRGTWDTTLTASAGAIPSPTAVRAAGPAFGTTAATTVGAGPFLVTDFQKGSRYRFERNPRYVDAPKPYLDSVEIRPVYDATARANTFRTGGADMTTFFTPTQDVVALQQAGTPHAAAPAAGVSGLIMRTDQGPTSDVRVREALQRGIDIDSVLARAAPGATKATTLLDPGGPWANDVAYPAYDPVRAQQLVDAYLADTGTTTVDVTLIGSNATAKLWEAFKQDWDKIRGLRVTLQIEDTASTSARLAKRDYGSLLNGLLPETPSLALVNLLSTSTQNRTFVSDPQLDAALKAANAAADVSTQRAAMRVVSERVSALVPMVAQYRAPLHWFWNDDVQGVALGLSYGVMRLEDVRKERG
jgi:peptide/nickel transport system substrate-binding protein